MDDQRADRTSGMIDFKTVVAIACLFTAVNLALQLIATTLVAVVLGLVVWAVRG